MAAGDFVEQIFTSVVIGPDGKESFTAHPRNLPDDKEQFYSHPRNLPDGKEQFYSHPRNLPDGKESFGSHPRNLPDGKELLYTNVTTHPPLCGPNWFTTWEGETEWFPGTIWNGDEFVRYKMWDGTKWRVSSVIDSPPS